MKKLFSFLYLMSFIVSVRSQTPFYTPGNRLLNDAVRGEVLWNQEFNNSGTCSPSYNAMAPGKDVTGLCTGLNSGSCNCDHKPAGCGAVAMAQTMWYWQWPIVSSFRTYSWNLMPGVLAYMTPQLQANAIAQFLRDCGDATGMNYCCAGSWTTMNSIHDALINNFNYNGVDKRNRSAWPGDGWNKLIRAEIDAGRPVIYRGGSFISGEGFGDIHIFVCDGYQATNHDNFHFNWGWGNSDDNLFWSLDNLTPGVDNDFNGDQMAIIGISPSYNIISQNITDVAYTSVSDSKTILAKNSITLPADSKTLTVNSGGSFTMFAGNAIYLNPGFSAQPGSYYQAQNRILNSNDCGMSIVSWTNYFPLGGNLRFNVYNANTFEIQLFNLSGQLIFQNAGYFNSIPVSVWDGTGSSSQPQYYTCNITFRNNCGEKLSNSYLVLSPGAPTKSAPISELKRQQTNDSLLFKNLKCEIFPNPCNGQFTVSLAKNINAKIEISDLAGKLIHQALLPNLLNIIDLSNVAKGIYMVKISDGTEIIIKKLVIE